MTSHEQAASEQRRADLAMDWGSRTRRRAVWSRTARGGRWCRVRAMFRRLRRRGALRSRAQGDPGDIASAPSHEVPVLRVAAPVMDQIRHHIGGQPAETGGMIGVAADGVVRAFYYDTDAEQTATIYTPNTVAINHVRTREWRPRGLKLSGFVHSHPPGFLEPSQGDLRYATQIIEAVDEIEALWIPIVQTEPDTGRFQLRPFLLARDRNGHLRLHEGMLRVDRDEPGDAFVRVAAAYDLRRMAASRLTIIGCGGSASFIEAMARAGVGEFVLIDPDVVDTPNLATQQVYRRDIGRAKVDAIADRVLDINPAATVVPLHASLDALSDEEIGVLVGADNAACILCGFTDDFETQARVNRLALHFGVPSLSAQLWQEGRGGEIVFTYPGVTPACQRCALGSRYRALLGGAAVASVGSAGTPIFATERVNALKGQIALAMLHHRDTDEDSVSKVVTRYDTLLERIGDRNLILVRMDPDLEASLGIGTFSEVLNGADATRLLFDEAVFLPQEPERPDTGFPQCEDCGGGGDLRQAVGTITDTRIRRDLTAVQQAPDVG